MRGNSFAALDEKGEWHFSRVLEGMAIQDVIVLPGFEYGTTLRVYNPGTIAWDVAYCYTGNIMRFEARKQDVTVMEDGKWHVKFDLYAERIC